MLQGNWVPLAAEMAGQKLPEESLKGFQLTLQSDEYLVQSPEGPDRGKIKLDEAQTPKAMDILGTEGPNAGKTILAIYELSGDTLKICYALQGGTRPSEFKTEGGQSLFLVTYQRAKN